MQVKTRVVRLAFFIYSINIIEFMVNPKIYYGFNSLSILSRIKKLPGRYPLII